MTPSMCKTSTMATVSAPSESTSSGNSPKQKWDGRPSGRTAPRKEATIQQNGVQKYPNMASRSTATGATKSLAGKSAERLSPFTANEKKEEKIVHRTSVQENINRVGGSDKMTQNGRTQPRAKKEDLPDLCPFPNATKTAPTKSPPKMKKVVNPAKARCSTLVTGEEAGRNVFVDDLGIWNAAGGHGVEVLKAASSESDNLNLGAVAPASATSNDDNESETESQKHWKHISGVSNLLHSAKSEEEIVFENYHSSFDTSVSTNLDDDHALLQGSSRSEFSMACDTIDEVDPKRDAMVSPLSVFSDDAGDSTRKLAASPPPSRFHATTAQQTPPSKRRIMVSPAPSLLGNDSERSNNTRRKRMVSPAPSMLSQGSSVQDPVLQRKHMVSPASHTILEGEEKSKLEDEYCKIPLFQTTNGPVNFDDVFRQKASNLMKAILSMTADSAPDCGTKYKEDNHSTMEPSKPPKAAAKPAKKTFPKRSVSFEEQQKPSSKEQEEKSDAFAFVNMTALAEGENDDDDKDVELGNGSDLDLSFEFQEALQSDPKLYNHDLSQSGCSYGSVSHPTFDPGDDDDDDDAPVPLPPLQPMIYRPIQGDSSRHLTRAKEENRNEELRRIKQEELRQRRKIVCAAIISFLVIGLGGAWLLVQFPAFSDYVD